MADFVALTDAETNAKAFTRQALWKKLKDNFDNLDGRTAQLEKTLRLFDHFNVFEWTARDPWAEIVVGSGVAATISAYSVVRIAADGPVTSDHGSNLRSRLELRFDQVTKPIIFEARCQWGGVATNQQPVHKWGMFAGNPTPTPTTPRGIYLEIPNTTQMRFASQDSVGTFNGTLFTRVAPRTWFVVKIEFTNTPSDRALCYIDGVLKETITANLPTTERLSASICALSDYVGGSYADDTGGAGRIDTDYAQFSAVALNLAT